MEFNQKELEHLLNCLNFYYAESDYKAHIMEVNSTLCKKIDEQLVLHRIVLISVFISFVNYY